MATKAFNAATLTAKVLASTRLSTTSATAVYTVGASKCAKVSTGTLCNISTTAAVTVSLAIMQSGSTDDGTHTVLSAYSLAAGDTLSLSDFISGHMLGEGDFISVTAGTANVLCVVITGAEGA